MQWMGSSMSWWRRAAVNWIEVERHVRRVFVTVTLVQQVGALQIVCDKVGRYGEDDLPFDSRSPPLEHGNHVFPFAIKKPDCLRDPARRRRPPWTTAVQRPC